MRQYLKQLIREWRSVLIGVCIGAAVTLVIIEGIVQVNFHETPLPYQKSSAATAWLPSTVKKWAPEIDRQAKKYNIDANFVAIILTLESGGYSQADSGVAKGLMQVTDPTGKDIAKMYLKKSVKHYDLYDSKTSIEFGTAYLAHLRTTLCDYSDGPSWDSCVEAIAAGYNGGPGAALNLINGKGLTDTQTIIYSRNAFNMWRERGAKTSPTFDRWQEAGGQRLIDAAAKEKSS